MSTSTVSTSVAEEESKPISHGPFLPLLLIIVAFLGWTIFETAQLIRERSALKQTWSTQAAPIAQAQKIRAAANSMATRTKALADAGDPNAQVVIAQLRQRGITINPNASVQSPP